MKLSKREFRRLVAEIEFYDILAQQAEMTDSPRDAAQAASARKILQQKELVDSLMWGSIYWNLARAWLSFLIRAHIKNYTPIL